MNADCDFQIGKDHLVCQDYAIAAAREGEAYAILCDGCSASPDVDIGARLLALGAKEAYLDNSVPTYENMGYLAIHKAASVFTTYRRFHPQALDATLLLATIKGLELKAYIYGDGVFFHKSVNGLYAMKVELTSGAPDYLSYNLDPKRKKDYEDYSTVDKEVKEITSYEGESRIVTTCPPFTPVMIARPVQPGDIVALCSDGIGSFRKADNTTLTWLDMTPDFVDFQSTSGIFVKRRLNAMRKKWAKDGWTHGDDISVAAIVV